MRRSAALAAAPALALALALTLAACSSGGGSGTGTAAPDPTVSEETTTTVPSGPPAILTGLPIGDPDDLERPALSIKIENAPQARPQSGLDRADVVYEEVVEGGVVRFLAVYQSQDAKVVGPVRSLRPVDPDIVWPIRGLFAYSGGAPQFERLIKKAPVRLVGADQEGEKYERRAGKRAPHNLYTSTEDLFEEAKKSDRPPPALFRYATGPATGRPASHVTVVMGPLTTAAWDWDTEKGRWLRTTNGTAHVMEDGPQLAFANVIVQYVKYTNTTSRDQAGFAVPTAEVIGKGDAVVFAGGTRVTATWEKDRQDDVTGFRDATGVPILLQPGPTWVMLAPVNASTTPR